MNNEWYSFIKKYSIRTGDIAGFHLDDITDLSWQVLKHELPDFFENGKLDEAIHLILQNSGKNITLHKVKKLPLPEKELFLLWVHDQYEAINNAEQKYLYSPPEAKMIRAGINELDVLEDINLIDNLAGGDILKWDSIRNMRYSEIFSKQLKLVIEKRIHKKLSEQK